MHLPPEEWSRLQPDPEKQVGQTSTDNCNFSLRSLYKACPHPFILNTTMGTFGNLNTLMKFDKTWPLALNCLNANHSEFLHECMTTLSLLSPELLATYCFFCIRDGKDLEKCYSILSIQIHVIPYSEDMRLHGLLGFLGYLLFIEHGSPEYKETARTHLLKYASVNKFPDYYFRILGEIDPSALKNATGAVSEIFYLQKWKLMDRGEILTDEHIEAAKYVFDVDVWDDNAFTILESHYSQFSEGKNRDFSGVEKLVELYAIRLEYFEPNDHRTALLWEKLAYALKELSVETICTIFSSRISLWKGLFYQAYQPRCVFRYYSALKIFHQDTTFIEKVNALYNNGTEFNETELQVLGFFRL